jgi:hypothetical protein
MASRVHQPVTAFTAEANRKRTCYDLPTMAVRTCVVCFKGVSGVRHCVEVEAESLYEAAVPQRAGFVRISGAKLWPRARRSKPGEISSRRFRSQPPSHTSHLAVRPAVRSIVRTSAPTPVHARQPSDGTSPGTTRTSLAECHRDRSVEASESRKAGLIIPCDAASVHFRRAPRLGNDHSRTHMQRKWRAFHQTSSASVEVRIPRITACPTSWYPIRSFSRDGASSIDTAAA